MLKTCKLTAFALAFGLSGAATLPSGRDVVLVPGALVWADEDVPVIKVVAPKVKQLTPEYCREMGMRSAECLALYGVGTPMDQVLHHATKPPISGRHVEGTNLCEEAKKKARDAGVENKVITAIMAGYAAGKACAKWSKHPVACSAVAGAVGTACLVD